MSAANLTAAERETVIITDDELDTIKVTTWQRTMITRLRNAGWEPIEETNYGSTVGAVFELPIRALSFRSRTSVERQLSEAEKAQRAESIREARKHLRR